MKERTVAIVAAVVVVVGCSCAFVGFIIALVFAKRAITTGSVALAGKVGRASAETETHAVVETVHIPHITRDSSHQARMMSHIYIFVFSRLVLLR